MQLIMYACVCNGVCMCAQLCVHMCMRVYVHACMACEWMPCVCVCVCVCVACCKRHSGQHVACDILLDEYVHVCMCVCVACV